MAWRVGVLLVIMQLSAGAAALTPSNQGKGEQKTAAKQKELPPGEEVRASYTAPSSEQTYFIQGGTEVEPLLAFGMRMVVEGGLKLPGWIERVSLRGAVGYGYFPQIPSVSKGLFMSNVMVAGGHRLNERHHLHFGLGYGWGFNPAAPLRASRAYTMIGLMFGYAYHFDTGVSLVVDLMLSREQFSWLGNMWMLNLSPMLGIRYGF